MLVVSNEIQDSAEYALSKSALSTALTHAHKLQQNRERAKPLKKLLRSRLKPFPRKNVGNT